MREVVETTDDQIRWRRPGGAPRWQGLRGWLKWAKTAELLPEDADTQAAK